MTEQQGTTSGHAEGQPAACPVRRDSPGSVLLLLRSGSGSTDATCLEMRLTAPPAVRGGKNSSENQRSPDSVLLRILSRSRSRRSASSTGVEQRELSPELSPPLLLAPLESLLHVCQLPPPR